MHNFIGRVNRRGFIIAGSAGVAGAFAPVGRALARNLLTIAQPGDVQPQFIMPGRQLNFTWVRNVFESLAYVDPKTFKPTPLLAETWKLSDDGLTLDMKLRGDVTFHSGRKMTAEDARYSIQVAGEPTTAAQLSFVAKSIAAIDVKSPTELVFTFKKPLANFFEFLERTPIIDKETYAQRKDGSKVIGTGPYRFASWRPGASLRLERYSGYRDPKAASIRSIEIIAVNDPTALISALRSGRAQMVVGIDPRDTVEFVRNPMYAIVNLGGAIYPFGVDVKDAPFDKKVVRQALGYAVDRARINDQVFNGTGTPTPLFWQPGSPGYSKKAASQYPYDPDRARKMIADAGAKGATFPISLHALPTQRSIFEIIQNNLREVGLNATANILDVQTFGKQQIAGELGPAFIQLHGMVGLSAATLLDAAPALRKGNPSHFWTDEYVSLRKAVQQARTNEQSAPAVEALTKYMNDEAFNLAVVQAPVQGVASVDLTDVMYGLDGYVRFDKAKLA